MNRVKNRLLTKCQGDKWIGMKEILGSEKRVHKSATRRVVALDNEMTLNLFQKFDEEFVRGIMFFAILLSRIELDWV